MSPMDPPGIREALVQAIQQAQSPLSAAQLARAFAGTKVDGKKLAAKHIAPMLAGDVDSGRLFAWGKNYWNRDPETLARERLLAAASEMLGKTGLATRAAAGDPKLQKGLVNKVRDALLREGRLREMPAAAGSKSKRVIDTAHPWPFLESEIAALLASFGIERPASQIRTLLGGAQGTPVPAPSPVTASTPAIGAIATRLFDAMTRIAFSPGASVTFQRLRTQPELAALDKRTFDEAALLLQKEAKVFLNAHGFAKAIAEQEREQLVTDGYGNYYVSIFAR
ncbi:MAG: hypothetical protein R2762_20300 [Bryobacteraceae bacterium]